VFGSDFFIGEIDKNYKIMWLGYQYVKKVRDGKVTWVQTTSLTSHYFSYTFRQNESGYPFHSCPKLRLDFPNVDERCLLRKMPLFLEHIKHASRCDDQDFFKAVKANPVFPTNPVELKDWKPWMTRTFTIKRKSTEQDQNVAKRVCSENM
jgi:hypothetical protein